MSASNPQQPHILIIGAGITGLTIAHGLQNRNIPFTIFEAEPEGLFKPREWTMGIHWSLENLKALLPKHLCERLVKDASVDPSLDYAEYPNNSMRIYEGVEGRCVKEVGIAEGEAVLRVSRRKLRKLCAEGSEVKYDHRLCSIVENPDGITITASFANGATATGTLLIGAEGSHSAARSHLVGAAKAATTPMELTHVNNTVCYNDAAKALFVRQIHPVFSIMQHPEILSFVSMQDVPDPNDSAGWKFQVVAGWLGARGKDMSNVEKHKELKAKASVLAEPFRSTILWTPDDVEILYNDLGYWIAEEPWDTRRGRITLAGDSAHSLPPHRGQGLNNALQDAYNIVQAVEKVVNGTTNQAEEMQKVSDEIAERGARETRLSIENAYKSFDGGKMEETPLFQRGLNRPEKI